MVKIVNFIRITSNFILIVIILSYVINLAWIILAKNIYWPLYAKGANVFEWSAVFGFFLFLPVLVLSNFRESIRLVIFVIILLMSCLEFAIINDVPDYLNSIRVNNKTLFLGEYAADSGTGCYQLLECEANGTYCKATNPNISRCRGNFEPNVMLIDDVTNEVNIFTNRILAFTYGAKSYSYEYADSVSFEHYVYWIVYPAPSESPLFKFGRCSEVKNNSCEILSDYSNAEFHHGNLVVDTSSNKLLLIFNGLLTYTFGDESRKYDHLDFVETMHSLSNDHPSVYRISTYKNGSKYYYILYECNAEYFWCQILPLQYSTFNTEKVLLRIDESKKELSVYATDKLIFVYGEHPHCYVVDCQILDQKQ